jgi:hypothetical protein
VRGTTAAVGGIWHNQRALQTDKIAGFSSYHNFFYRPNGVVMHKTYENCPEKLSSGKNVT